MTFYQKGTVGYRTLRQRRTRRGPDRAVRALCVRWLVPVARQSVGICRQFSRANSKFVDSFPDSNVRKCRRLAAVAYRLLAARDFCGARFLVEMIW